MTLTSTSTRTSRRLSRPRPHHRRTPRVLALTALGAAAALGLGACAGSGVPDLQEVWPEAYASIEDASSVAVDGNVSQGGQDTTVKFAGQIDDSSYAGRVSMNGVTIEIIGNTEHAYMKPNTAFYEQNGGAQLQDMVGDKWLRVSAGEGVLSMSTLWESIFRDIPEGDEFSNSDYTSEKVELDGEQVYKYTVSNEDTGKPVSVYLSQDNRLLRVEAEAGATDEASGDPSGSASPSASESAASDAAAESGIGTMDFEHWNSVGPAEMPAEDEVFAVPAM
ncbi:hypothetical protein [Microbacterium sp. A93]|uniref:hypothetical protein n=1 Tax=Microbacterium sp. A93 TaxID=3450716 RepID=UPI003F43FAAF